MGLAATQARYLGLTARKTNIEFEGQQINQQRTALANQTSSLYQKLYSMTVPTPPSVTDYYKTEYTYSAGGTKYHVNSYTPEQEGGNTYTVNVTYTSNNVGLYSNARGNVTKGVDAEGNIYYEVATQGSSEIHRLFEKDAVNDPAIDKAAGKASGTGQYCTYTDSASTTKFYMDIDWLKSQVYPIEDGEIQRYYKGTGEVTENHEHCTLTYDATGQVSRIIDPTISGTELSMAATETQDTEAYQDAMNQYVYNKELYEKEIASINAETQDIQSQDRSLELQLRQLDTEQEALQTELSSLKSVLDKNIEKVFKVFA